MTKKRCSECMHHRRACVWANADGNKYPEGSLSLPEVLNQVRLVQCWSSFGQSKETKLGGQTRSIEVRSKFRVTSLFPETGTASCQGCGVILGVHATDSSARVPGIQPELRGLLQWLVVVPRSNPPRLGKPSEPFTLAAERICCFGFQWFLKLPT